MEMDKDIISMDHIAYQDILTTLLTKSTAHPMNPFFMHTDNRLRGQYYAVENNKCTKIYIVLYSTN